MNVLIPPFDPMDSDIGLAAAVKQLLHEGHGAEDTPDCPCRATDKQEECAALGCGFCKEVSREEMAR